MIFRSLIALLTMAGLASAQEPASIPSNFNTADWIFSTTPPDKSSENEGAFRFICNASHNAKVDPIVYPGQADVGHLHTFAGNTTVNKDSTYSSLRQNGNSTCQGGPLNRSSYWMPSMMTAGGQIVMPDYLVIYYKGKTNSAKLPRGLRYIFGKNMANLKAPLGIQQWGAGWPEKPEWECTSTATKTATIPQNCASGRGSIIVRVASPDCWDGVNLDSANHRSHMAYQVPRLGPACPPSHPIRLPQFSFAAVYTQTSLGEANTWYLASDRMIMSDGSVHNEPAGSTFHTDWFGAWDDGVLNTWHTNCIAKALSCVAFSLGDSTAGKAPSGFTFDTPNPRLVDPPAAVPPPVGGGG